MLLGSAHPAKNHSAQAAPAHSSKDSFLTAQRLGRQFRDVTETECCPLGAVVQQLLWPWSYGYLHDGTTVHCLPWQHRSSLFFSYSQWTDPRCEPSTSSTSQPGPYLTSVLTRAPGPSNFSDN